MKARLEIDLTKIRSNGQKIFHNYQKYPFKMIDLRNNVFGLGIYLVNEFANMGFNYGYTSTLEEAIKIRHYNMKFPILIKNRVNGEEIYDAINNNITITIGDLNYLQEIDNLKLKDDIKIHLFIDNGSNVFGLKSKEEIEEAINIINRNNHIIFEGIYTEFTTYGLTDSNYYQAFFNFKSLISDINKEGLIIHANEVLMYHPNDSLFNGLKIDLALFGLTQSFGNARNSQIKKINKMYNEDAFAYIPCHLELTFSLVAYITYISYVLKGELVERNYVAKENKRIALINIGHKDGITKAIKLAVVNGSICSVLADNIDEVVIGITEEEKIGDKVYLISEYNNIDNVLTNLKTNRYYLMSILNSNLPRVYIDGIEEEEIIY